MDAYGMGMIAGFILAMILTVIIVRKRGKNKYDEYQELIQGRGHRIGFLTSIFGNMICVLLYATGLDMVLEPIEWILIVTLISIFAYATYCIIHNAYIGLNQKWVRIVVLFSVIGILNLGTGISDIASEVSITGIISLGSGIMLTLLAIEIIIKELLLSKDDE